MEYDAYFSHVLKCKCGLDMVPKRIYRINKLGDKVVYINYRCQNKKDTCNKDISHKKLENLVSEIYPSWVSLTISKKIKLLRDKNISIYFENDATLKYVEL